MSGCRTSFVYQHLETHEPREWTKSDTPGKQDKQGMNLLPAVDLSGLNHDQQIVAEMMLREGYESFSSSEQDIDCIPDMEIDINLKESQQVQKRHK